MTSILLEPTYKKRYDTDYVINLLKCYKGMKKKLKLLEYEIENYKTKISKNDVIECLTFKKGNSEIKTGINVNKISNAAISYEKIMNDEIQRYYYELVDEYNKIKETVNRIEYYVELLEDRYSEIFKLLYFQNYTFTEAAIELHITISSLKYNRKLGIDALCELYNMMQKCTLHV